MTSRKLVAQANRHVLHMSLAEEKMLFSKRLVFSSTCLAITHDSPIVALESRLKDISSGCLSIHQYHRRKVIFCYLCHQAPK